MMEQMIKQFPAQISEALAIDMTHLKSIEDGAYSNVFISGMGGSGIGANFVAEMVSQHCKVPISVGKSYDIPVFLSKATLYMASSYSGNTEETIEACKKASKTGATIVIISSGGQLKNMALDNHWHLVEVPSGWESPRACLGYSITLQICVLEHAGLIDSTVLRDLKAAENLINYDQEEIMNKATKIAQLIQGKIPFVYTSDQMSALGLRWCQQFNENAKILAHTNTLPEMNHNELVGWKLPQQYTAVLFLRNKIDHPRVIARTEITKEILSNKSNNVVEIFSKGQSIIEKMIYFTHLGDWVSYYLATLNATDVIEIEVIDFLKSEMAKLGTID